MNGQVVKGGEQLLAVGCRYQGPGVWSAGVAEELVPSELDLLEGHARDAGGHCLWARALGLGDGFVVDLHWCGGDGVDLPRWRAREGVGHDVVHSADVPDVAGEFCQVAEVSALPGCPWLHRIGKGVGQRLVVGVQGELPALQHESEVPDPQHPGQKLPVVG
jgi:hypothetical protein